VAYKAVPTWAEPDTATLEASESWSYSRIVLNIFPGLVPGFETLYTQCTKAGLRVGWPLAIVTRVGRILMTTGSTDNTYNVYQKFSVKLS